MAQRKDLNPNIVNEAVNNAFEDFLQMAKDMGCDVSHIRYPERWCVEQWCTKNDIYFT